MLTLKGGQKPTSVIDGIYSMLLKISENKLQTFIKNGVCKSSHFELSKRTEIKYQGEHALGVVPIGCKGLRIDKIFTAFCLKIYF